MRYCGSKRRFMKYLKPILMEHLDDEKKLFVDAFGGGMNVISEIDHKNKMAIELNRYVCALWKHIQHYGTGLLEAYSSMTEQDYYSIKQHYLNNDGVYPDWLIGFAGTCCSYGGAWFNGYAHFNPKKNEDHIKEAFNGLKKQVNSFKYFEDTVFINASYNESYNEVMFPSNSVIYCDPPYESTKSYETDFNHIEFWDWVRKMSKNGHYVYVSEYSAPDDFKCIWQMKKKDGMGTTKKGRKQNTKIEKLFIYNGK